LQQLQRDPPEELLVVEAEEMDEEVDDKGVVHLK
jgi:hypothetical protein